jgi:SAM-dependent methyltransferase
MLRANAHRYHLEQCLRCGCVFTDVSEAPPGQDYYTGHYYSFRPYDPKQVEAWKASAVPAARPERILDVGCGSGEWLFRQQLQGHEVWGVEIDERAVKAARANGLQVFRDFAGVPDGHFDFIRLSHVLEHTRTPTRMMRAVKDKLAPGGRVELLVPNADSAKFSKLLPVSKLTDVPRHLCFFSAATMRRLLEKIGFQVELIEPVNVSWRINLRETLGDMRRLVIHAGKSKAAPLTVLSLLKDILWIHLGPAARTGVRKDWLLARATVPAPAVSGAELNPASAASGLLTGSAR